MKRPRRFKAIQIALILTSAAAFSSLPAIPGARRATKLKSSTFNDDRTMDSFDQALKQLQTQNKIAESLEIRVSPPQELEPHTVDAPSAVQAPPHPQHQQQVTTPETTPKRSNLRDALQRLELKTVEQSNEDQSTEGNMPKQDSAGIYEITSKEQHAYVLSMLVDWWNEIRTILACL